jgi:putative transposase
VLDDSSRFILAWDLKAEQTAEAISEVVQQAVEWTGMPAAPVESRARLLTDPGSGYLAAAFENYLRAHHPQTNGKLERFHETLKARLNLLMYTSPERLRAAMADFIRFYNHERYHERIGHVTPADVYDGRREAILRRRAAQQRRTQAQRVRDNRAVMRQGTQGELTGDLSVPCSLTESQRC